MGNLYALEIGVQQVEERSRSSAWGEQAGLSGCFGGWTIREKTFAGYSSSADYEAVVSAPGMALQDLAVLKNTYTSFFEFAKFLRI